MAKKDKILVTGAGGFVGSHMICHLLEKGYKNIRATDLARPKNLPEGIEFIASNLCERKSLEEVTKEVNTIFHIADLFDFFAPWEELYRVNVVGTKNLCEAAYKNFVRSMIKFSSAAIYKAGEKCNEEALLSPVDRYAMTKLLGEVEAARFNGDKLAITIVRPAVIYGKGSCYSAAQAFLTQAIGAKLFGTKILPGKGNNKGCYAHVDDIVAGTLHLYENNCFTDSQNISDMAYNIGDDDGATPGEIAEMVFGIVGMNRLNSLLSRLDCKLRLPKSLMAPLAVVCEEAVKAGHKAGLLKSKPKLMLERGAVDYMFLPTHFTLDNSKLKSTGYMLKHPSSLAGMPEVIRWYEMTGWETFKR